MNSIYLDYNAQTPCDMSVIEAMNSVWSTPGNPHSSHHAFGWQKEALVNDCLTSIANIYDCFEEDLIFTSGATEANNFAICSGLQLVKHINPLANTILTSQLEHKSVLSPLHDAADKYGFEVIYVDITEQGILDLQDLQKKMTEYHVAWVSCPATNGVIGTNQPIIEVSIICQNYNAMLHIDASQAGYSDISCHDLEVDFLTMSAHKIYGPSGIGLLYSKHLQNPDFKPLIIGGGQQNGLRAGTLATPLIVGLTKAIMILDDIKHTEAERLMALKSSLLNGLQKVLPVSLIGDADLRHPGNLYLAIDGVDSMQLLNNVQPKLAFSLGSACDGLTREYSPLIKALGVSKKRAEWAFRICTGRLTTQDEIDYAIELIAAEAQKIQH